MKLSDGIASLTVLVGLAATQMTIAQQIGPATKFAHEFGPVALIP